MLQCLIGVSLTGQEDTEDSSSGYREYLAWEEDYFPALLEKARAGDPEAQYEVGRTYAYAEKEHGKFDEGLKLLTKAAEQGHAEAQEVLGQALWVGELVGFPTDKKNGIKWLKKAAENGQSAAQANLGVYYYYGNSVKQDFKIARRYLESAAQQREESAQFDLGIMYLEGNGAEQNNKEALKWFTIAWANGYKHAPSAVEFTSQKVTEEEAQWARNETQNWFDPEHQPNLNVKKITLVKGSTELTLNVPENWNYGKIDPEFYYIAFIDSEPYSYNQPPDYVFDDGVGVYDLRSTILVSFSRSPYITNEQVASIRSNVKENEEYKGPNISKRFPHTTYDHEKNILWMETQLDDHGEAVKQITAIKFLEKGFIDLTLFVPKSEEVKMVQNFRNVVNNSHLEK